MAEAQSTRKFPLWPLMILPVIGAIAFVVYWLAGSDTGNAGAEASGVQIPVLGGTTLRQAEDTAAPGNSPSAPAQEGSPAATTDEPTPEHESSDHEIDSHLSHLAHATRVGDARGKQLAHTSLGKCMPPERVNRRTLLALDSQPSAWVRIEYFHVLRDAEPLNWANRVLERRAAQFLGTDDRYEAGEIEELLVYTRLLVRSFCEAWASYDGQMPATPFVAFFRSVMETERPQWALEQAMPYFCAQLEIAGLAQAAEGFHTELRGLILRATAPWPVREAAFRLWLLGDTDFSAALQELESPGLRPYLCTLLACFAARGGPQDSPSSLEGIVRAAAVDVAALINRMLADKSDWPEKRLLIQRLGLHDLPGARELLESGLQRRDAWLGAYLAAWGRVATSVDDLQQLVQAVSDADAATASGAIEGLRSAKLPQAGDELKQLVEQGANPGVQSMALGALLQRDPAGAAQTVENYLSPDRDAALRAVAVAHIPAADTERMKRVVEEDAAPRVRQAALTRLGETKDLKLKSFFNRVMITEQNLLLAQVAKKYYQELQELEREQRNVQQPR